MNIDANDSTNGQLVRDIALLRDRMLNVHYYEESHWLAAAAAFPHLCHSPLAQDALRRAATIAWQFGFPGVSHWINSEVLNTRPFRATQTSPEVGRSLRLPAAADII
jgi:hypothetical protein